MDGNRVPGCDEVADGVGQVQLTLGIDRLQPVESRPQELGAEDVDRRVRLVDPSCSGRGVDGLDDRLEMPAGVPDDSTVAPDVGGNEGEHGCPGALRSMRLDELLEKPCRQQGCVPRQDQDVVRAGERLPCTPYRVARAE